MYLLHEFLIDERGEDGIEYGLLIGLIFLVIVGAVAAVATAATDMFFEIAVNTAP